MVHLNSDQCVLWGWPSIADLKISLSDARNLTISVGQDFEQVGMLNNLAEFTHG